MFDVVRFVTCRLNHRNHQLARDDIPRGGEAGRAMPNILLLHAFHLPRLHGLCRMCPFQCLNACLFIGAQNVHALSNTGLAVVFGVIVYLISDHLIGLFTNDPQLIEMGSYILHVTFLSLFITGMTTLFMGVFQATAQGIAAFIMSVLQGITLIPVLFIANRMNGFHGVVWSLVIADTVAFFVGAIMLYVLWDKLQPELDSLVQ